MTEEAVEEHLEGCEACQAEYDGLCRELPAPEAAPETQVRFAALMKGMKRHKILSVLLAIALTAAIIVGGYEALVEWCFIDMTDTALSGPYRAYRLETERGPRFIVFFNYNYTGIAHGVWEPVESGDPAHPAAQLHYKRAVINTSTVQRTTPIYFFTMAANPPFSWTDETADYETLKIGDTVVWSAEENGDDEIPVFIELFYEQLFHADQTQAGFSVNFYQDYVVHYRDDGTAQYWDWDGHEISGPGQ